MRFRLPSTMAGAILFVAAVVFTFIGCEHEQALGPVPLQSTLSSIQTNIFTPKCVNQGCHPGGGAPANMSLAAGVARGNLVGVTSVYGGLQRVKPGDPANSVLYLKVIQNPGAINPVNVGSRMPFNGPPFLSQAETDTIAAWINAGAPN